MITAWLTFTASLRLTFWRIGTLLIGNVLWLLLTLLIVTAPPASAGLHYLARRLTDPEEEDRTTWRHFFEGLKIYWLLSWQVAGLNWGIGMVLIVNLFFYVQSPQLPIQLIAVVIFYIFLVWLEMQLYLFPLLIEQQDKSIRLIFKNALLLTIKNPGFTFTFGLLLLSMLLVSSALGGPIFLILFSFIAIGRTYATRRMLGIGLDERPVPRFGSK